MTLVLVADIGGTKTSFGLVDITGKSQIVLSESAPTSNSQLFIEQTKVFLQKAQLIASQIGKKVTHGCFAAAGPVVQTKDSCQVQMTNVDLLVDKRALEEQTDLTHVIIINDLAAIAYATRALKANQIKVLQEGSKSDGPCIVLAAGTGLGKATIFSHFKQPMHSEGGHGVVTVESEEEWKIVTKIRESNNLSFVTWEHLVSGPGLENIYRAVAEQFPDSPESLSAREIGESKNTNPCSKETFNMFVKFFARCAKNFALDCYATGGVFIAGGLVAKNSEAFTNFHEEFSKHPKEKFHKALSEMPLSLITDYEVSLLGCAEALR